MIEVKVTVLLPGIPEALNRLADAISGSAVPVKGESVEKNVSAEHANPVAVPAEAHVNTVNQTSSTEKNPMPVQPEPIQSATASVARVSAEPVAQNEAQTKITLHDLSIAGAKMVENGKMNDVIGLLKNFGVPAITSLAESQYESFAAGLRNLGANI